MILSPFLGWFLVEVLRLTEFNDTSIYIPLSLALCEIIWISFCIYVTIGMFSDYKEEVNKSILDQEERREIEQHNIDVYNMRLKKWEELCTQQKYNILDSRNVLDSLYSENIIYKDYHHIIAISAFLKYFESQRVTTFPEAYDRFELEYRLDKMEVSLNEINAKLDTIIDRLDAISSQLTQSLDDNKKLCENFSSKIDSYLNSIVDNQENQIECMAAIENNQKVIAENTKVLKYIENTRKRTIDLAPFSKWYRDNYYKM